MGLDVDRNSLIGAVRSKYCHLLPEVSLTASLFSYPLSLLSPLFLSPLSLSFLSLWQKKTSGTRVSVNKMRQESNQVILIAFQSQKQNPQYIICVHNCLEVIATAQRYALVFANYFRHTKQI